MLKHMHTRMSESNRGYEYKDMGIRVRASSLTCMWTRMATGEATFRITMKLG